MHTREKNVSTIETALAALNTAWQAASEEMYKATKEAGQQQPNAAASGAPNEEPKAANDGNVTDVDFEEVKEDKK
jgi:molecular chaperone DnaK